MRKVVQIRHKDDVNAKRYTFNVPCDIDLHKGELVRVRNCHGKEGVGYCVTDSEELSDNAIDMIMSGEKVRSDVIGWYRYIPFEE